MFQALSVFRGGFTWDAARGVAGAGLADLRSLIAKSLLQRTPAGRCEMHELLRQFAVEKLCFSSAVDASAADAAEHEGQGAAVPGRVCISLPGRYCLARGEQQCTAIHDRHCAYYAEFLYQREMDVFKGHVHEIMGEIDNIRTAWRWAARHGKAKEILKSSISLWLVHNSAGWVYEGTETFGRAAESLRREGVGESAETREVALGLVLAIQSFFLRYLVGAERPAQFAQEGLSILRRHGSRRELALGLFLASFGFLQDDRVHRQLLEEGLAISQETGFYLGTVLALRGLGRNREALKISRAAGDRRGMTFALVHLGEEAYARQEYVEAKGFYEESLVLAQEVGIQWVIAYLYTYLGDVALAHGEYEVARERYREALDQSKHIHHALAELRAHNRLGRVALAMNELEPSAGHYRQALEIAVESHADLLLREDVIRLDLVAGVAELVACTDGERAVELAALSRHHPASMQETKERAQRLLDDLRAGLSLVAYAAAQERGRSRDLEATLAELLAELEVQDSPGVALDGEPGYLVDG